MLHRDARAHDRSPRFRQVSRGQVRRRQARSPGAREEISQRGCEEGRAGARRCRCARPGAGPRARARRGSQHHGSRVRRYRGVAVHRAHRGLLARHRILPRKEIRRTRRQGRRGRDAQGVRGEEVHLRRGDGEAGGRFLGVS